VGSRLSPDRIAVLTPLLGSLGRMVSRGREPSEPDLTILASGVDTSPDAVVLAELSRWTAILLAVHRDSSPGRCDAAVEALLLRGVPEAPAVLAVEAAARMSEPVSATQAAPAPDAGKPPSNGALAAPVLTAPRFLASSLDLGEVLPGTSAEGEIRLDGGPATLALDTDLLSVEPAEVGIGRSTVRITVRAPTSGLLWATLTARGPGGTASVPVVARVVESRATVTVASASPVSTPQASLELPTPGGLACPYCGRVLLGSRASFCGRCGRSLPPSADGMATPEPGETSDQGANPHRRSAP
jgi:hypothetical protein